MGVDTLVLLDVPADGVGAGRALSLADGCVVFTGFRFGTGDPAALSRAVLGSWLGALFASHRDPRGVLAFPDLLDVRGTTYAQVVAEVGSAGVWLPRTPPAARDAIERAQDAVGADLLAAFDAAARSGDPAAIERATGELQQALEQLDPALVAELLAKVQRA